MTAQPVEANVVLTADNSQYDQAMAASAGSTNNLAKTLDSLGASIAKMTKTAGKTLIGISAADVALITGATAAWSSYEKQMSRLQAQSAVLSRTNEQQYKVMKDYTGAVKDLRREYGATTAEAAKLTQTLSKITDVKQTRSLKELTKIFTDMQEATGESSDGLASSLGNLQKMMGKDVSNTGATRKYADMFTYLAAQTNTSAQSLIDFTAQLAPVGEQLGLNEKQLAGFATAFTKAGAEGGTAATVFTKVVSDINKSLVTGSPEMKTYANLLGITSEKFEQMKPGEQVVRIFEALQSQGEGAINTLNRLGLDGPRSIKSITQMINQAGGVREALGQAEIGYESDSSAKGREAAMKGLSDEFTKLREEMKKTAEAFATILGPMMEDFVKGMVVVQRIVTDIAEGPLGEFAQVIMGFVAPLAAGAGALLLFAGTLLKVAAAFTLFRNSASRGLIEGARGKGGIMEGPDGSFMARGDKELGKSGARLAGITADRPGTWVQRSLYNTGQLGGAGLYGIKEAYQRGRGLMDPGYAASGRGPLSYIAGGMGKGISTFLTPQLDQMRYEDETKRSQWAQVQSPMSRFRDQWRMGRAEGAVGRAQADLLRNQMEQTIARGPDRFGSVMGGAFGTGPKLDDMEKATRLDGLKQTQVETEERLAAAKAASVETQERINATQAQREATRATRATSTGFLGLTRSLAGFGVGAGAAVGSAAWSGAKALGRSPLGMPAAGMLGMGVLSATGVENNALMFGAMGATMGPWGAAAGGAVGLGMDVAGQNNKVMDSLKQMGEDIDNGGTAFAAMGKSVESNKEGMEEWFGAMGVGDKAPKYDNPLAGGDFLDIGETKNRIEGIFGSSDVEEADRLFKEGKEKFDSKIAAATDLAKGQGISLFGTEAAKREQLAAFMDSTGSALLAEAGITYDELRAAQSEGGGKYASMLTQIGALGKGEGLEERLAGNVSGNLMFQSGVGQQALAKEGDIALAYKAVNEIFYTMREQGLSYLDILHSSETAQQEIGDENSREYELQMAIAQKAQSSLQMQMPMMTRAEGFAAQLGQLEVLGSITPETGEQAAQLDQMQQQTVGRLAEEGQYFKQLLLAQDQFELQRQRGEDNYQRQRAYAEYDFNLQRERAEANYQRQRRRAVADFHRQETRAYYDYNLQRKRQEEDFNHSVAIMAKQQAQGVYDIYARVQTERTSSAEWILSNAGDQLTRMREQAENLDKLRKQGLSDNAIQQLKLNDPQNAQQLARFTTEMTPQLIRQFNKVAGAERVKAAKEIVTDPSSLEWQEMRRGFRRARQQGADDFERQMRISRKDFKRGLGEMDEDFMRQMAESQEDYLTGMNRQEQQYKLVMDQAAEDMANMAKEVDGNLETILTRATRELSGHAQKQAEAALESFKALKGNMEPEAQAVMKMLADIFGFEYKVPKASADVHINRLAEEGRRTKYESRADGGVLPGWTPGRDVLKADLSGGEAIMRPEWARAVGEKAIDAANHKAKYGGFAEGGVFWPVPGRRTSTYANHDGVDINRGSGSDDLGDPIRAFRSGKIVYVGSGRGYGDAIFQRTAAGTVVYGHTSAQNVHTGQMVNAGQLIGNVGSTGNSSAPHLHFGIPGGSYSQAMALLQGAMLGGGTFLSGAAAGAGASPTALLDKLYPKSERAAYAMKGVHPLDPGMVSQLINRYARRKIKSLGGMAAIDDVGDIGREPSGHLDNEQIVRTAARRMGWGDQWSMLRQLVMHESGFNNTAQNPTSTAYGMFQFLDGTWPGYGVRKTSDPWKQTQAGMRYIKQRYGDPRGAWDFWQDHNWYKDGAVFDGAQTIGVGEDGPEAVIPLNQRGGEFLADVMGSVMGGRHVARTNSGVAVYNTRVDRSTTFSGPITVQANNPHELLQKLQARQRVMALSRPSLTGSAA